MSPLRGLVTSKREQVLDVAARHHTIGSACSAQSPVVTIAHWRVEGSRSAHSWRIHRPVSRSDEQRVQDILDASDQILEVVRDGRAEWNKDRLRQLAVERLLEIIGESANSLSDDFRARYPRIACRDIARQFFRR